MNLVDYLISNADALAPGLSGSYPDMLKCIRSAETQRNSYRFLHYIRPDSAQGCFKIAKPISFSYYNKSTCSMATDGAYLYVRS